jgi:threonine dehydrogenase-like Zn-dependent dehydrogenase
MRYPLKVMQALYFKDGKLDKREVETPRPGRGEALVKVRYAGICSTDLEILKGYMDFSGIPGHEFAGSVEAPRSLAGRRVTGEINVSCGRCALCRRGLGKHCRDRTVLGISGRDGAFAEYLALPLANLHAVPDPVSDEEAVFTELLAAACEIPERVYVSESSRVAVLGDGRLAAMVAQVLRLRTKALTVIGVDEDKLRVFAGLGIDTARSQDAPAMQGSFDVVVECTGSGTGLPDAVALARPRGTVVLKSTFHAPLRWNPSPVAVEEITVVGSRCGPFETALELLKDRQVATGPFLTAIYPFSRWKAALKRARMKDAFKVLIETGA